jgi:hypothetical protein
MMKIGEVIEKDFDLIVLQDLVKEIEVTVGKYFKPGAHSTYDSVHDVVVRCIKSASVIYGEDEARKWAEGFKWDPIKLASDQAAFEAADFNIATLAVTRQNELRS